MFDKLLFLPLDIPEPPKEIIMELDKISYKNMVRDDYRTCYHIPIMSIDKKTNTFYWRQITNHLTNLHDYLENYIFPWANKSRVVIITTPPNNANAIHIDCSPSKFSTLQHKFRYVLQGNVSDLEFIGENENIRLPEIDSPFILCCKWHHKIINRYPNKKYTLALGAPWEPTLNDKPYINLLKKSYKKYKNSYLSFNAIKLPSNYKKYYAKN